MDSISQNTPSNHVDTARLGDRLMGMAQIGATPNGGVNRQALSAEDAAARLKMMEWAAVYGFSVTTDEIGNLYVRRVGTDPNAAPIMTGSHLDSQPTGGKFDGAYGVVGGFEALAAIHESGIQTKRPIEVVAWTNEEGSRFQPGCAGSAIFSGKDRIEDHLDIKDWDGVTVREALKAIFATAPDMPYRAAGGTVDGYIEAHIEQGPVLEAEAKTIGVVTGIQGATRFVVEIVGEEAHAGTAPLKLRKDALKSACTIVGALEELMADPTDTVRFTVGRFDVMPGSPNTVPGRVQFTIDFRHPDMDTLKRLGTAIQPTCEANARGCHVSVTQIVDNAPVAFADSVMDIIRAESDTLSLPNRDIASGAGHDAWYMTDLCPTGMIFVPCKGGVSHNEAESATPEDLAAGIRVLANSLTLLANR